MTKEVPPGFSSHLCFYWCKAIAVSKSNGRTFDLEKNLLKNAAFYHWHPPNSFLSAWGLLQGSCLAFSLGFSPSHPHSDQRERFLCLTLMWHPTAQTPGLQAV
jgi:hypothetical protein